LQIGFTRTRRWRGKSSRSFFLGDADSRKVEAKIKNNIPMNKEEIEQTLKFCDEVATQKREAELSLFKSLFAFSTEFMRKYDDVTPFHILLMELILNGMKKDGEGMKETAHSRFLWKILSYEEDKTYPILKSFYESCLPKKFGLAEKIKKPEITRETANIDILIQDESYSLIIENKRHDAKDQGNQLARYINFVKNQGKDAKQIYICYLPNDGKEPVEDSWKDPENQKLYKKEFNTRFKIVSFKNEVSNWLNNLKINDKNLFLQTAIAQYAYLIEKNM
jgi:hypothetical protein